MNPPDEMDLAKWDRIRKDESESAAPQAPSFPSPRLEAPPAVAADSDNELARFAELVLRVNAARHVS